MTVQIPTPSLGRGRAAAETGLKAETAGLAGSIFSSKEAVMKNEIGWSAPQEFILILEDLGARFYVCSPSIFGYGVREQDLILSFNL